MNSTSKSNKELLLKLRIQGYSYAQIAEKVGLTRQRVHQIVMEPEYITTHNARYCYKFKSHCFKCFNDFCEQTGI